MKVTVSSEITTVCPSFVGACVSACVVNTPYCKGLWNEVDRLGEELRVQLTVDTLKDIPAIAATRKVYKACGKDPSRYRPAAEALVRRILQGKGLCHRNTLVDLINLASMRYGYSIGGFDADMFSGDTLTLGIGKKDEPYDMKGGVGTPTSDNERTKIQPDTTSIVVLVNGYDGSLEGVRQTAEYIQQLLQRYCSSDGGDYFIYK